jgi:hypothetical protein
VSRLRRFEDYRFIGVRDTMRVYDCDDPAQYEDLEMRVREEDLLGRNQLLAFAPDTVAEARNRGFRPFRVTDAAPQASNP